MLSRGIGDVAIKKILQTVGYDLKPLCDNPTSLFEILHKSYSIDNIRSNSDGAQILEQELSRKNIHIITEIDTAYPKQLKKILGQKCPPVLFAIGNIDLLNSPCVGFCGSRNVSNRGVQIASQCASQLVGENITVVSGYAKGTDLAAHAAAMNNDGNTIFVLAEGILEYKEKSAVKNQLTDNNHVFVSQFMPHAKWSASNAMRRNSVIIGLSQAMILVESGKKGGTFAAGQESLRLNQPLFVVDYAFPEVSAEANPYFISHGGHPIRGKNGIPVIRDVLNAIKENDGVAEQITLKGC